MLLPQNLFTRNSEDSHNLFSENPEDSQNLFGRNPEDSQNVCLAKHIRDANNSFKSCYPILSNLANIGKNWIVLLSKKAFL